MFWNGRNSVQEELLPLICYFSKTVSSVPDKKHMEALGSCRSHSKCSSTVSLSCEHISTGQEQEGWQWWKNAVENKQTPWAPLWKPGEYGWSPKTPRRNPSWVCSIVGNFKIQDSTVCPAMGFRAKWPILGMKLDCCRYFSEFQVWKSCNHHDFYHQG